MKRSTLLIAVTTVVAGGIAVISTIAPLHSVTPTPTKSDRLSGGQTETAFLPERFGVPSSQQ